MTSTIEISLYPLNNQYPDSVLRFLQKLREHQGIEITTNGMSTLLTGEFNTLWAVLGQLMEWEFQQEDAIFVLKVAAGRREYVE